MLIQLIIYGKHAFFIQERIGFREKRIKIVKFTTIKKDKRGEEYIPDISRFIRNVGMDELPQLLLILKGDISLIGPRPLLVEYLQLYSDYHKRRHEAKPGITGLAQIKGRNNLPWKERFDLDVFYVDNISFFLDIKILFKTLIYIFTSKSDGSPAQKFEGY